jgi:hypothetical protein
MNKCNTKVFMIYPATLSFLDCSDNCITTALPSGQNEQGLERACFQVYSAACDVVNRHAFYVAMLFLVRHSHYGSGAKYQTKLIVASANISVLNDDFAWFNVPLIAVGRF